MSSSIWHLWQGSEVIRSFKDYDGARYFALRAGVNIAELTKTGKSGDWKITKGKSSDPHRRQAQ